MGSQKKCRAANQQKGRRARNRFGTWHQVLCNQFAKEQVDYIDEFFDKRAKAGHVRESKSQHCSPTFCVRKATGGWRVVYAYNKLNTATIPPQTPIPRKDVLLNSMRKSTIFSALDLRDGYDQVLIEKVR